MPALQLLPFLPPGLSPLLPSTALTALALLLPLLAFCVLLYLARPLLSAFSLRLPLSSLSSWLPRRLRPAPTLPSTATSTALRPPSVLRGRGRGRSKPARKFFGLRRARSLGPVLPRFRRDLDVFAPASPGPPAADGSDVALVDLTESWGTFSSVSSAEGSRRTSMAGGDATPHAQLVDVSQHELIDVSVPPSPAAWALAHPASVLQPTSPALATFPAASVPTAHPQTAFPLPIASGPPSRPSSPPVRARSPLALPLQAFELRPTSPPAMDISSRQSFEMTPRPSSPSEAFTPPPPTQAMKSTTEAMNSVPFSFSPRSSFELRTRSPSARSRSRSPPDTAQAVNPASPRLYAHSSAFEHHRRPSFPPHTHLPSPPLSPPPPLPPARLSAPIPAYESHGHARANNEADSEREDENPFADRWRWGGDGFNGSNVEAREEPVFPVPVLYEHDADAEDDLEAQDFPSAPTSPVPHSHDEEQPEDGAESAPDYVPAFPVPREWDAEAQLEDIGDVEPDAAYANEDQEGQEEEEEQGLPSARAIDAVVGGMRAPWGYPDLEAGEQEMAPAYEVDSRNALSPRSTHGDGDATAHEDVVDLLDDTTIPVLDLDSASDGDADAGGEVSLLDVKAPPAEGDDHEEPVSAVLVGEGGDIPSRESDDGADVPLPLPQPAPPVERSTAKPALLFPRAPEGEDDDEEDYASDEGSEGCASALVSASWGAKNSSKSGDENGDGEEGDQGIRPVEDVLAALVAGGWDALEVEDDLEPSREQPRTAKPALLFPRAPEEEDDDVEDYASDEGSEGCAPAFVSALRGAKNSSKYGDGEEEGDQDIRPVDDVLAALVARGRDAFEVEDDVEPNREQPQDDEHAQGQVDVDDPDDLPLPSLPAGRISSTPAMAMAMAMAPSLSSMGSIPDEEGEVEEDPGQLALPAMPLPVSRNVSGGGQEDSAVELLVLDVPPSFDVAAAEDNETNDKEMEEDEGASLLPTAVPRIMLHLDTSHAPAPAPQREQDLASASSTSLSGSPSPSSATVLLPRVKEAEDDEDDIGLARPAPAWSLRAAHAPALGLRSNTLPGAFPEPVSPPAPSAAALPGSSSSATSSSANGQKDGEKGANGATSTALEPKAKTPGLKRRSPLDAALAMQLRPGLGAGADGAWLVRFLMSFFGWFAVLVAGGQEFN